MSRTYHVIIAVILSALGGLYYWPIAIIVVAFLALSARYTMALLFATFFDLLWGAPPEFPAILAFPFVLGTLLLCIVRISLHRYLRERGGGEYI